MRARKLLLVGLSQRSGSSFGFYPRVISLHRVTAVGGTCITRVAASQGQLISELCIGPHVLPVSGSGFRSRAWNEAVTAMRVYEGVWSALRPWA